MLVVKLVYNLAVLVAASIFSGFIDARWGRSTLTGKILQGITFGLIAVVAMLNPFVLTPGIIFDGRSIVLSLCTLFFGPLSGVIAGLMALVTRVIIGGGGTLMGVSVITSSVIIGLLYYYGRKKNRISLSSWQLYVFGILVHIVMILLMILLPSNYVRETMHTVAITVILFYPFATVLIGKILYDQENSYRLTKELREREKKYRSLFDNDLAGNFITDPEGNLILCNQAFARIFGFGSVDELQGVNVLSYYKDQKLREEIIQQLKLSKKIENLELVLLKKDLNEITVLANVIGEFDESNTLVALNGYVIDITERKKAEKLIKTLSNAIEQSPLTVIITNSEGKIEYVNKKFTETTQYSFEEVKDKTPVIFDKVHFDETEYRQMWDVLNHGDVWIGEYLNHKKDGTPMWEEVTVAPIYIDSKIINNYVIITENITEKKKILEELITAKEKAEESDKLKSAFLANMSHEIRTPMNSILGFTGLLKKPDLSELKKEKYVELIEKSGQRMLNTLNDLINISRIEAGEVKVYFTNTNINKLLAELSDVFGNEARLKGIKLTANPSLPMNDAVVKTDDIKLHAVLTNLIKNALKFTHEGSIDFGYWINEKEITFFVRDTGKGISPEFQKKLFQRFVQEESGYTRMYEGSGLGLSISKAYVEMLGGKIWLEYSAPEKGTEFRFTLPYMKGSEEIISHVSNDVLPNLLSSKKINILIAEDDDIVFEYLSIVLGDICKTIQRVKNGLEAVEVLKNNGSFDLVLMDIKLPVMDGLTAARKIREFDNNVVIIAQTAFAFNEDRQKAIEAGCNDYISKPIKADVLLEKVRKLLLLEE